jgi:hypothetical protein
MDKIKIYCQKHGSMNEVDRLELARLLLKSGYIVRIGRERKPGKSTYNYFVEYWEGDQESCDDKENK